MTTELIAAAVNRVADELARIADVLEAATRDNGGTEELRTVHVAVHQAPDPDLRS